MGKCSNNSYYSRYTCCILYSHVVATHFTYFNADCYFNVIINFIILILIATFITIMFIVTLVTVKLILNFATLMLIVTFRLIVTWLVKN